MTDLITTGAMLAVANKLLGKTAETISEDLSNIYIVGRDKIISAMARKISNHDDKKQANLRVARDVFWNGSFTDENICAEYFGGILASSRSGNGRDDRGIYYTDIIKSLSSQQLLLHYLIYHSLNVLWLQLPKDEKRPNVGMMTELQQKFIWFSTIEIESLGTIIEKDLIALHNKGLVGIEFEAQRHNLEDGKIFPYTKIQPSTLGVQLYAVAHNKLNDWRNLPYEKFGDFPNIKIPKIFGWSVNDLLLKSDLKKKNTNPGGLMK